MARRGKADMAEDDMDDEEEMHLLRKSSTYNHHAASFGLHATTTTTTINTNNNNSDKISSANEDAPQLDEESLQLQAVFGISSFGKKKGGPVDRSQAMEKVKRVDQTPSRPPPAVSSSGGPPPSRQEGLMGPPRPVALARAPDLIGPPRPAPSSASDSDSDEDEARRVAMESDEDDEEDASLQDLRIPVTHEIELKGHHKAVSAMTLDPTGSRLLTAGFDYVVKFWDFAGMDATLRSFREIEPCGGHQIKSLQFSSTGDRFLIASGSSQPKIFDKDGFETCEFVKGDMYLSDMAHTKGHIASISNALWHPNERDVVMTSSIDGTVRIWDVNDVKKHKTVIKAKNARGTRTGVTTCAYGLDGRLIAATAQDGSLQIWKSTGPFMRPDQLVRDAHCDGSDASCISFSLDGHTMLTRGGDDTLKIWDLRNMKQPVHVKDDLPNFFAQTDCLFSPDERFIVTGTSIKKDTGSGLLVFYDKNTFAKVKQLGISKGSVIRILWHRELNQIILGSSDAKARVLFDPSYSRKGALMCVARAPRQVDAFDYDPDRPIHNPHSLPLFKPEPSSKRKREKARMDPIKSRKPDVPTQGPGSVGGRVGGSFTSHLLKAMGSVKPIRDEDPREAILKYAKEAEENPFWFKAYKKTQPITPFDTEPDVNEQQK